MRTFEQIRQEIVDEKNIQLPELSSSSTTAIWWLWANIVASAIFTFEQIVYSEQSKLEKETELKRYGSINWYAIKVLEFQLGDPLVFDSDTGLFDYAVIDPVKQIVARVSVNEGVQDHELLIKVAKDDNGSLIPLIPSEITLLSSYLGKVKVAGVDLQVLSLTADVIDGVATIYYDGNYMLSDVQIAIENQLNIYRDTFSFNGVLLFNDIVDLIRGVPGVDDVLFSSLTGQHGVLPPVVIIRDYKTVSGYFNYASGMVQNWTFEPRFNNPA